MNTVDTSIKTQPAALKMADLAYIGLCAALIAVCSWISIPAAVPFTLQTFAVFLSVFLLGGKRGTLAVTVYLLLGAVGLPVFAGFKGGPGALFGTTGGYLIGFLASALIMWGLEKLLGTKLWVYALSMILGLLACYAFGTVWFITIYNKGAENPATLATVLGWCVIPFIIPDAIKILLALVIGRNPGIRAALRADR